MSDASADTLLPEREESLPVRDDAVTISAIGVLASIVADVLHEAVGHGLTALATGASSGLLTSVAWSSTFDSRLVAAGGTLVNLPAALVFWLTLRAAKASMAMRYFLVMGCAFNLFAGTGYFFFSGVTDFGDWAAVIAGTHPHWLWRTLLIVVGGASYYAAVRVIGVGLVRYVGIPREQQKRLQKFLLLPYFSSIVVASAAAVLNPVGIQLLWESALAATAGGQSGMLWLRYYIPRGTTTRHAPEVLGRNYIWVSVVAIVTIAYIAVLGRGVTLHR